MPPQQQPLPANLSALLMLAQAARPSPLGGNTMPVGGGGPMSVGQQQQQSFAMMAATILGQHQQQQQQQSAIHNTLLSHASIQAWLDAQRHRVATAQLAQQLSLIMPAGLAQLAAVAQMNNNQQQQYNQQQLPTPPANYAALLQSDSHLKQHFASPVKPVPMLASVPTSLSHTKHTEQLSSAALDLSTKKTPSPQHVSPDSTDKSTLMKSPSSQGLLTPVKKQHDARNSRPSLIVNANDEHDRRSCSRSRTPPGGDLKYVHS
jgi:hypothetical protein